MASNLSKKDPLSRYFKDLDEFELSSNEDSEEENQINAKPVPLSVQLPQVPVEGEDKSGKLTEKLQKPSVKKLPSADDCLKNQSKPAFLRLKQQKEVDWDKNIKSIDQTEGGPVDFETNAVPPPTSYEPVTDLGTNVVDSEGNKRKRYDDEPDQVTPTKAYKVYKDDEDENL
ncbi:UPF0690 protein C1orf52 homolog [Elysia marginata]|uniref:UPF0690 protein C1orf52 homolog n=1 Tax=Elysia marginata TaxID=1093978 RepID=A0AAV4IWP1_9GAST|nr:UPF0690 protein C1orf52 homolog [Elysia marginata]